MCVHGEYRRGNRMPVGEIDVAPDCSRCLGFAEKPAEFGTARSYGRSGPD